MRVLIADDSQSSQAVMRAMLRKLGHRCDTVNDGAEAVAAFRGAAYGLVMMDLMMPLMNGIEATRRIRALSLVPIIALTADTSAAASSRLSAEGANFVLAKPVTLAALDRCIAEVTASTHQ